MLTADTLFLVVDDIELMRKINASQLATLGYRQTEHASNGQDALKKLQSGRFGMVLSDWNMPVMDGLELLRAVRADEKLAHLPFLMITAEAERVQIVQAVEAGVSGILVKPYNARDLGEKLLRAARHKPVRRVATAPTPAAKPAASELPTVSEKPTVLVVDDTPDNLSLIAGLFSADYRVKVAQDGAKALAICGTGIAPDLVLADVMMPNMDGFEFVRQLRCLPTGATVPVIFITALTEPDAIRQGLELGAIDFLAKPIEPVLLKLKVANLLRHVELTRQLQAGYDNLLDTVQQKEEVEQIVRHDLKGPIGGTQSVIQGLLGSGQLSPRQRELLQLADTSCQQVLDLIQLSGDLYKIETGRFQLQTKSVEVIPLLRQLAELGRLTYAAKNLSVVVDVGEALELAPPRARGDARFCHSALHNLLKNACEAAPANSRVTLELVATAVDLTITIENEPAVPFEIRDTFFEKYASHGKSGGSGLGTYSAKLLTEAQNGQLVLDIDDDNNRTRLRMRLPVDTTGN